MTYKSERLPTIEHPESFSRSVQEQLDQISQSFESIEFIILPVLHSPPDKPQDGMIVLADGTNWNPGSGAGFYGRRGGSWVLLG